MYDGKRFGILDLESSDIILNMQQKPMVLNQFSSINQSLLTNLCQKVLACSVWPFRPFTTTIGQSVVQKGIK